MHFDHFLAFVLNVVYFIISLYKLAFNDLVYQVAHKIPESRIAGSLELV